MPEIGVLYCGVGIDDAAEIIDRTVFQGEIIPRLIFGGAVGDGEFRCQDDIPFFSGQRRRVLALCGEIDPEHIEQYETMGGYRALERVIQDMRPDQVIRRVMESGLLGRGGAGFPPVGNGSWWPREPDEPKFVVCNGDEGDPGHSWTAV